MKHVANTIPHLAANPKFLSEKKLKPTTTAALPHHSHTFKTETLKIETLKILSHPFAQIIFASHWYVSNLQFVVFFSYNFHD